MTTTVLAEPLPKADRSIIPDSQLFIRDEKKSIDLLALACKVQISQYGPVVPLRSKAELQLSYLEGPDVAYLATDKAPCTLTTGENVMLPGHMPLTPYYRRMARLGKSFTIEQRLPYGHKAVYECMKEGEHYVARLTKTHS